MERKTHGVKRTNESIEEARSRALKYYITALPNYVQFVNWYKEAFNKGKNTANDTWKWVVENVSKEGDTSVDVKRWRRINQLDQQIEESDNPKDKAAIIMMASKLEGIDVNRHEIDATVNAPKSLYKIDLDTETHEETDE